MPVCITDCQYASDTQPWCHAAHYPEFVPSLDDIARFQTSLTADDVSWLHALVTDWQIIADLSFSDLVLWVPDAEAKGVWAGAQIRPTTGPTTLLEDVAGTFLPTGRTDQLEKTLASGELSDEQTEELADGTRFRMQAIPVTRADRTIAVISRRSSDNALRTASSLENTYLEAAAELVEMIQHGEFPFVGHRSDLAYSLRVGDGLLRTDRKGLVSYASPNAMSAYRRLGLTGDLVGADLGEVTTGLIDRRPTDHSPVGLLRGTTDTEARIENPAAALLLRVIPLRTGGHPNGALILLRDVTELRVRERELVSKEATIREIHHRVKNNLQTVASLLRLQGRRTDEPEVKAALDDAERRVGSIALVHETLSQSFDDNVDFDEIADRLIRTVLEVSRESSGVGEVRAERIGSFGSLPGSVATPLAMALTELIQNAVEHAYRGGSGGTLTLAVNRIRDRVRLRVSDDGAGLPAEFDPTASLGLSIVTTLVEGELGGSLSFEKRRAGGTTVIISLAV
jgi:two-component sensor histidine kinase